MTWIRFDPYEPAAPSLATAGHSAAVDFRGRASQVLFFGHGAVCPDCALLAQRLAGQRAAWAEMNAETILVSPHPFSLDVTAGAHVLTDPDGQLRDRYARLLEFDTTGYLFLFVLDEHGAPFAVWVGQEATVQDLVDEATTWLAFAERQCPE